MIVSSEPFLEDSILPQDLLSKIFILICSENSEFSTSIFIEFLQGNSPRFGHRPHSVCGI